MITAQEARELRYNVAHTVEKKFPEVLKRIQHQIEEAALSGKVETIVKTGNLGQLPALHFSVFLEELGYTVNQLNPEYVTIAW